MKGDRAGPEDVLIRPDGQVERLDLPEPATVCGSYAETIPSYRRLPRGEGREHRTRARYPEHLLRGRLIDLMG